MLTDAIKNRIAGYWEEYLENLEKLVAIKSISNDKEAKDGAPFGSENRKALEFAIGVIESWNQGWRTFIDPEGYYAYAEIGEGEEMIGMLGHLDVVPPGDLANWKTDPWKLTLGEDGKYYGRGAQDDKGPTLAAFYAVRSIIDEGVSLKRRIRIIIGTDEEVLWRGIDKYVEKEEHPMMGFTPDSTFPVKYAEKGLLNFILKSDSANPEIKVESGSAFNVVPDVATWKGGEAKISKLQEAANKRGYDHELRNGLFTILGKTAHASKPEKGINASIRMAEVLSDIGLETPISKLLVKIGNDYNMVGLFGKIEDEATGKLTFNVAGWNSIDGKEEMKIDSRVPVVTTNNDEIKEKTKQLANDFNLDYVLFDELRTLFQPLDSPLVKMLMKVYQRNTGDTISKPQASGGSTYAKSMDNLVAFGYVFPNTESAEHLPNEFFFPEEMKKAMNIFADALLELSNH